MPQATRTIALLGSTGSIGRSTLEVVAASEGELQVAALSAHSSIDRLREQSERFLPRRVVVTGEATGGTGSLPARVGTGGQAASGTQAASGRQAAHATPIQDFPAGVELLHGEDGLRTAVTDPEVDVVVAAIVGSAGLKSTWAALEAGKTVALANKETLVMAGGPVTELARRTGGKLIPVDSEHSAVFQCLQCGRREDVRRVILTASGGPFRTWSREQLEQATVEQALDHPNWDMGPKITVDSATMMNKALEILEARWLFDLAPERIEVVVHPQSVVHSMVEFVDGAVLAQLSPPDMRLPIQYALTYPLRRQSIASRLDWRQSLRLEFDPPDLDRFPALGLGYEAARTGGTSGAVLNAANEAAVAAFLARRIRFTQIVPACGQVLSHHPFETNPTLERLLSLDRWARQEMETWISRCSPR